MSEIEWGPEIKVDGKRPDGVARYDLVLPIFHARNGVPMPAKAISIWDAIKAIRMVADHPYYAKPELSGADGSSYYDLQINGVTVSCNDVIDALGMNFNMGEAFKALWRCGRKPGTSKKYDLDKVVRFAQREANRDA